MKLSIIIVTYNSQPLIKDCIDSIMKFSDLPLSEFEIIVVDNSEAEEGARMKNYLSELYPDLIDFYKNENYGYGHGNNVGIRAAKGEIIAVMNPDVRLLEPLFLKALQHFTDSSVGSVGFNQVNDQTNYSFFIKPEKFIPVISSLFTKVYNKLNVFNADSYYLAGAFVFFNRKDFIQIGLYDESIFMYYEEPDVAHRLSLIGKKTVFDKSKSYQHLIEVKDSYNKKLIDIGSDSIRIYFTKHQFNLKDHIRKRLFEHKIHRLIFLILGNKDRVQMADTYITSLRNIIR